MVHTFYVDDRDQHFVFSHRRVGKDNVNMWKYFLKYPHRAGVFYVRGESFFCDLICFVLIIFCIIYASRISTLINIIHKSKSRLFEERTTFYHISKTSSHYSNYCGMNIDDFNNITTRWELFCSSFIYTRHFCYHFRNVSYYTYLWASQ